MNVLKNVTNLLHISYPIIQGGMGNVSHATLAAAISNAGGLGTIGAGTMTAEKVEQLIIDTKRMTDQPYCVNIPINVQPSLSEVVEVVKKQRVPVVSLSAGNPRPFIPVFQALGTKVICVVATVQQAKKAEQAGADVIVAEGYEAAGINSQQETTTFTLIPQVVQAVSIPVIAAGGIADGKGLAAVWALGAAGVQMGTRFIATKDADVHETYKQHILQADDTGTTIVGRSLGLHRRLLKTPYAKTLKQAEAKVSLEQFQQLTGEQRHWLGAMEGKETEGHMNGGQIAGYISDLPTVDYLLRAMMEEAVDTIHDMHRSIQKEEMMEK